MAAALLIAITVIIGAALASTVLLAPSAEKPVQLQVDCWASINTNEIRLSHLGGDPIYLSVVQIQTYIPLGTWEGATTIIDNSAVGLSGTFEAGDTITIPFDQAFSMSPWSTLMAPNPGEQFRVEMYYNSQPIASVMITTLP